MVTADEVAEHLGEVLNLDVKAFAVPRAGWAKAFEQFGIPKGHTAPAEEMFEAVNAGWMDLGVECTEHVAGTTSARDVFAAAQKAMAASTAAFTPIKIEIEHEGSCPVQRAERNSIRGNGTLRVKPRPMPANVSERTT